MNIGQMISISLCAAQDQSYIFFIFVRLGEGYQLPIIDIYGENHIGKRYHLLLRI